MPPTLTPEQQEQYFATQSNAAAPLSPLAWLDQQGGGGATPSPTTAPAPTLTPAITPPQEQTIAETFNMGDTDTSDEVFGRVTEDPGTFGIEDEDAIKARTLEDFRRQIDATNNIYDNLVRDARREGEGREGVGRAISARGGLLGSDFATARQDKIQQQTFGITRGINAERDLALSNIQNDIRTTSSAEITAKRAAKQKDADSYLEFLQNSSTAKEERFSSIIARMVAEGVDINDLTPEEFKEIADNLGKDDKAVVGEFSKLKAEANAAQATADAKANQQEFDNEIKTRTRDTADDRLDLDIAKAEDSSRQFDTTNARLSAKDADARTKKAEAEAKAAELFTSSDGKDVEDQVNRQLTSTLSEVVGKKLAVGIDAELDQEQKRLFLIDYRDTQDLVGQTLDPALFWEDWKTTVNLDAIKDDKLAEQKELLDTFFNSTP